MALAVVVRLWARKKLVSPTRAAAGRAPLAGIRSRHTLVLAHRTVSRSPAPPAMAGIQGGLAFFIAPSMLIDAALYAGLGLILMKWKARRAAVLLLVLSGFAALVTAMNKLGLMSEGGTNIILALIVFWAAIWAVEATFKLHGKFARAST